MISFTDSCAGWGMTSNTCYTWTQNDPHSVHHLLWIHFMSRPAIAIFLTYRLSKTQIFKRHRQPNGIAENTIKTEGPRFESRELLQKSQLSEGNGTGSEKNRGQRKQVKHATRNWNQSDNKTSDQLTATTRNIQSKEKWATQHQNITIGLKPPGMYPDPKIRANPPKESKKHTIQENAEQKRREGQNPGSSNDLQDESVTNYENELEPNEQSRMKTTIQYDPTAKTNKQGQAAIWSDE